MRFIALALIALVAITTVRADAAQDAANMLACILKIEEPCKGDATCQTARTTYNTCLHTNGCNEKTTASDTIACMKPCIPSDNAAIKTYANAQIACMSASVLSFAGLLLAIFAFVF